MLGGMFRVRCHGSLSLGAWYCCLLAQAVLLAPDLGECQALWAGRDPKMEMRNPLIQGLPRSGAQQKHTDRRIFPGKCLGIETSW